MSIRSEQLRIHIIRPVLQRIGYWSESAENLLLRTAAQETNLGRYWRQTNGPALGMYQLEPDTHTDLWHNYLRYKEDLSKIVQAFLSPNFTPEEQLVFNLGYATAIARTIYLRVPEPLPDAGDISGMANYYKRVWNTSRGKATPEQFIQNYQRYVQ